MPPALEPDRPALAIVLAGGAGRRLGHIDKPALTVGRRTLLQVALAAVAPALTVVVGPPRQLPEQILQTREVPAGGGPAAGVVAGLAALGAAARPPGNRPDLVAVLAADLPGIRPQVFAALTAQLDQPGVSGAVLVDDDGRLQYLAGVWRLTDLAAAARSRPTWHGGRVSDLLGPLIGATVLADRATTADVDSTEDLVEWSVRPADAGAPGAGQGMIELTPE